MSTNKKCPFCSEEILADALKCKHCGEWVNHNPNQTTIGQNKKKDRGTGCGLRLFGCLIFIIACAISSNVSKENQMSAIIVMLIICIIIITKINEHMQK